MIHPIRRDRVFRFVGHHSADDYLRLGLAAPCALAAAITISSRKCTNGSVIAQSWSPRPCRIRMPRAHEKTSNRR